MRRRRGTVDGLLLGLALAAAAARIAKSRPAKRGASGHNGNTAGSSTREDVGHGARGSDDRRAHDLRPAVSAWAGAWTRRGRGIVDALLLVLALAAAVADIAAAGGSVLRPLLTGLAALFVPGAAILTFLRPRELLEAAATAVGLSLAVGVIGSLILVWSGWFHPVVLAGAIAVPSGIALAWDLRRCLVSRGELVLG